MEQYIDTFIHVVTIIVSVALVLARMQTQMALQRQAINNQKEAFREALSHQETSFKASNDALRETLRGISRSVESLGQKIDAHSTRITRLEERHEGRPT